MNNINNNGKKIKPTRKEGIILNGLTKGKTLTQDVECQMRRILRTRRDVQKERFKWKWFTLLLHKIY